MLCRSILAPKLGGRLVRLALVAAALASMGLFATSCSDSTTEGPSSADAGASDDGASKGCPPGLAGCVDGDRVVCNETGTAFAIEPCGKGNVCDAGACVACIADSDCAKGEVCQKSVCATPALAITSKALPTALVGQAYSQALKATGGVPPYTWKLAQGALPAGILVGSDGEVKGVATATATA